MESVVKLFSEIKSFNSLLGNLLDVESDNTRSGSPVIGVSAIS